MGEKGNCRAIKEKLGVGDEEKGKLSLLIPGEFTTNNFQYIELRLSRQKQYTNSTSPDSDKRWKIRFVF